MPTVFELFGLRFFFYSDDHPPIHVHVERGDDEALKLVKMYKAEIVETWNQQYD